MPAPALPPGADPTVSSAHLLFKSWPGRLFLVSAALKIVFGLLRFAGELPRFVGVLSSVATIGLIVSVSVFAWRLFVLMKRRLLWRVRRRLILSYIFIGVVPSLLIMIFFLLGGVLIFMNVSAYLFKDGYDAMFEDVRLATEAMASEMSRSPESADQSFARIHRNAARPYPVLSFVYVPVPAAPVRAQATPGQIEAARREALRDPLGKRLTAGPWEHMPAPQSIPAWLIQEKGRIGTIALPSADSPAQVELVIRGAQPVVTRGAVAGFVIADLPIGLDMVQKLEERTRVRAGAASVLAEGEAPRLLTPPKAGEAAETESVWSTLYRKSVIFLDYYEWETGKQRRVSMALSYRPGELYRQLSGAQQIVIGPQTFGEWAIVVLLVIAALFLIIEIVALIMGLALARSITSAIHELFMGTERVRHGDFAHRIDVYTNDQLGELAGSFNQMTGSIEELLQTAAEKKRLEEELRIARADPDVAAAARSARRAGPGRDGAVRARARGRRGLLRLLPAARRAPRRADRRRLRARARPRPCTWRSSRDWSWRSARCISRRVSC